MLVEFQDTINIQNKFARATRSDPTGKRMVPDLGVDECVDAFAQTAQGQVDVLCLFQGRACRHVCVGCLFAWLEVARIRR